MNATSHELTRTAFDGDRDTVRLPAELDVDVIASDQHGSEPSLDFQPR